MNAYSEDLRRKIVEAVEQRAVSKSEVARLFGVSLSSVKRYARLAREGGPLASKKRPGSPSKISEEVRLPLEGGPGSSPSCHAARQRRVPGAGHGGAGQRVDGQ